MKLKTIAVLAVLMTLFSCQDNNVESQADNNTQHADSVVDSGASASGLIDIDWSKIQILKDQLVLDLQKDSENRDKYIIGFLDAYSKLEKEYNEILFASPNYDSLNVLAYAPEDNIDKSVIAFKEEAETKGFRIAQSEGMVYFTKNTDFIKSGIMEFLDPISMEFINLYCQEIDTACCRDAAIVISEELLVNRALNWGDLIDKVKESNYKDTAESSFNRYLFLVYSGEENTPSFDRKTTVFSQGLLESMKKVVADYPDANASNAFKEYIVLLEQSGFRKTNDVDAYLKTLMQFPDLND